MSDLSLNDAAVPDAATEFYALADAVLVFRGELSECRGVSPGQARALEQEAAERCASIWENYLNTLKALVESAAKRLGQGSNEWAANLPEIARMMDTGCDAHLAEIGVTGAHHMETQDGRRFPVPEYFKRLLAAVHNRGADDAAPAIAPKTPHDPTDDHTKAK